MLDPFSRWRGWPSWAMWRLLQCEVISGYSVLFHSLASMSVLCRSYSSLGFYGAFVPLLVWVPLPVLFGDSVIEQPSPRFWISSSTQGGKQTVLASVLLQWRDSTAVAAVRKENSCLGMACSFRGLLHRHHGRGMLEKELRVLRSDQKTQEERHWTRPGLLKLQHLQWHTSSSKAAPSNPSQVMTKYSNMWVYGSHSYSDHHRKSLK